MSSAKKSMNADVVLSLPAREKTDLLAQALLREYMHRRGYKKTLSAFDIENPRTETTISSRQLMSDLMKLQAIQDRNRRMGQGSNGLFATIMETLCSYRIRKHLIRHERARGDDALESTAAGATLRLSSDAYDSSDEERELTLRATARQAEMDRIQKEQHEALAASIATKREELEALTLQEAKLTKQLKKAKKLLKASNKGVPSDVPGSKRDPLKEAMERVSALPMSSSSQAGRAGVGRNWTPGGGGRPDAVIPDIGISSMSAPPGEQQLSDRPPSFVAGEGFHLMADMQRKVAPVWQAPRGKEHAPTTSGVSRSDSDEDVPSPYRLGKTPYDHNATRPGILSSSGGTRSSRPSTTAPGVATREKSPSAVSIPRTDSGSSLTDSINVSRSESPLLGATPQSTGFHFSHTEGSPSGAAGERRGDSSQRKSRRVTILAD